MSTTEQEPLQSNNVVSIFRWLLKGVVLFLGGVLSPRILSITTKVAQEISKELLIIVLLFLLAGLTLTVSFLLGLWDENKRLKQDSIWYPMFGAVWRYRPLIKTFDQYPYCNCGERHICQVMQYENDAHVEILSCPKRSEEPGGHFMLRDDHGNWLKIKDANERLRKIKLL